MTPGTARFQEKREAILDGAARQFNLHGIRGGTLAGVAASVGLATNSLTYYYRRKEDLATACLLRSMEALASAAAAAGAAPDLRARIRGFLANHLGVLAAIAEGRHAELVVFSDLLSLGPPHAAVLQAAYTQMFRSLRRLLQARDAPPLPRDALNARTHLLLSLTSWSRAWITRFEPVDYVDVAWRMADLLLDGLAAPGRTLAEAAAPPLGGPAGPDPGRRVAYLAAATRLVNQHGYRGASVDRIATELGLTKGSFYHHHETKEELIAACFERTFEVMRQAQQAARSAPGSGLERLALACRALLRFQMSADGPLLRVTAWMGLPDAMRLDTQLTMTRLGERFSMPLVEGMADGSVRVADPSIAAQMVNGMVNAAAELERWVAGARADNVFELFGRPLFVGLRVG